ncbi:hypothetical protein I203_103236 [Kwoniella mangroviensis CBS 8507]|uniref:uncharacterized protein n=1 Tax=Kwoniella mangroviensis CBS 8507 TaxID=1296122 RepID=UPI00080D2992|nr:uncharacterized protein I203_05946 [Kwoniella mangroviensis CBS 8507]OCF64702.1 hypothetical protein I203_05946 [Kwoniella mangroviensis CBS 8507]
MTRFVLKVTEVEEAPSKKISLSSEGSSLDKREMICYGSLKLWLKLPWDDKRYFNIHDLPQPEKTYRTKEMCNILIIEIANWAAERRRAVYQDDVKAFLVIQIGKRRPGIDWYSVWLTHLEKILIKLHKLGIDTNAWLIDETHSHDPMEVISISSVPDGDQNDIEVIFSKDQNKTNVQEESSMGNQMGKKKLKGYSRLEDESSDGLSELESEQSSGEGGGNDSSFEYSRME